MSKVKFLNKWREENNQYSPTHDVQNIETDADLPSDEPSSPLSTYSLTFDGEKWQIPFQEENMKEEIFFLQELHHQFHKVNIINKLFANISFKLNNI